MNGLCCPAAKIDKASDKLNKPLLRVTPSLLTDNRQAKPFGIFKASANAIKPLLRMAIRVPGGNQIVGVVLNIGAVARTHQMARGGSMLCAVDKGGAACAILQSAAAGAQFRQNNSCVCWPVFPTMAVIKGDLSYMLPHNDSIVARGDGRNGGTTPIAGHSRTFGGKGRVMRQIKIGLALGSGAAKGWAHIGVINALKKLGIEADIVAGCSMGALVGAAYACHRLPAVESWVRSFSYWDVIRLMDLSWQRGGLLRGERVFNAVAQLLQVDDIAQCSRKFAAVATNLSTGRELWLTEGDLNQAVRASCSIPGLLAPVWFNGYWLVDGAVVNPVPISLTRALGADVVIAVDLQHDAHLMQQDLFSMRSESEDIGSMVDDGATRNWRSRLRARIGKVVLKKASVTPTAMEIMSTSIQVLENRIKRARMAGDPPDVLIQPYCPQISTLDFHRANEAIAAGELAVEKQIDMLLPLVKNK